MPNVCDFNRKETNVEKEICGCGGVDYGHPTGSNQAPTAKSVRRHAYDVLGSVLEHMAIAYSADGRVNVRFPAEMIREALRAGAVQLRRRNRQRVARRIRKGGAR